MPLRAKAHLAWMLGGVLTATTVEPPGKLAKATSLFTGDLLHAVPIPSPPRVCSQMSVLATREKVPLSCVPMIVNNGLLGETAIEYASSVIIPSFLPSSQVAPDVGTGDAREGTIVLRTNDREQRVVGRDSDRVCQLGNNSFVLAIVPGSARCRYWRRERRYHCPAYQ